MSTVTRYNLRATRACASLLPRTPKMPGAAIDSLIASHGMEMTPLSEEVMTPLSTDVPFSYSDIAKTDPQAFKPHKVRSTPGSRPTSPVMPVLRSPSPVRPGLSENSPEPGLRLDSPVVPDLMGCINASEDALGGAPGTMPSSQNAMTTTAAGVIGIDPDNNNLDDGEWTTMVRKGWKRHTSQERQHEVGTLDAKLRHAVKQAEARLTPDERRQIKKQEITVNRVSICLQSSSKSNTGSQVKKPSNKRRCSRKRQVAVNKISIHLGSSSESEPSSHGEGPSNLERGKGVDPRNWGDLSDTSDINLEEQQTILESCNLARELAQVPDEVETDSQQSDDHENIERTNKKTDHPVGKGKTALAA